MKTRWLFTSVLGLFVSQAAFAETAPVKSHFQPYVLDSGLHTSKANETTARLDYSKVVTLPDAAWVRLIFAEAALGKKSYLTVTSLKDGATQRLDTDTIAQWRNSSAYFNGNAVRVELHVAPGDSKVLFRLREVLAGDPGDPDTQCGAVDDRISSTDARAGRLLTIGCTAWLIGDGRFVTAGHCLSSAALANTVEFNVPPSLANGTLQHPGPEDQYIVDDASRVFVEGGIGNDWGVFETFPNSQTGLTALQKQGASFHVVQDLTPPTLRITGYGVDGGAANQTEQTSTGPNAGSSGTTMRYKTDTEGGNSGSPIIDEASGNAVGIHTNGGCTTAGGGSNSGTSNFNTALWAQIGNSGGTTIDLSARARQRGTSSLVLLRWSPADGGNINILRNGAVVRTVPDNGKAQDNLGSSTGTFSYQVCETDSSDCSEQVTLTIP